MSFVYTSLDFWSFVHTFLRSIDLCGRESEREERYRYIYIYISIREPKYSFEVSSL